MESFIVTHTFRLPYYVSSEPELETVNFKDRLEPF